MKTANCCVTSGYYLRTVLIVLVISFGVTSLAPSQPPTRDFTILSPQHVVDLVQVEQITSNALRFTFKNASNKTILESCISALRGLKVEEMVCMNGFAGGALPEPGGTMPFIFDASGFVSDGQPGQPMQRSFRVDAVVYTDGSYIGSSNMLDKIEDYILGVALETKRVSDILANCPDDGITGLDSVLPSIGTSPPSLTAAGVADKLTDSLQGQSLGGISQSYIESHLNLHTNDFLMGVAGARERALREIHDVKATAALPREGGEHRSQAIAEATLHGRADLAQKYQLLSASQINYLAAFKGERDAH